MLNNWKIVTEDGNVFTGINSNIFRLTKNVDLKEFKIELDDNQFRHYNIEFDNNGVFTIDKDHSKRTITLQYTCDNIKLPISNIESEKYNDLIYYEKYAECINTGCSSMRETGIGYKINSQYGIIKTFLIITPNGKLNLKIQFDSPLYIGHVYSVSIAYEDDCYYDYVHEITENQNTIIIPIM